MLVSLFQDVEQCKEFIITDYNKIQPVYDVVEKQKYTEAILKRPALLNPFFLTFIWTAGRGRLK